MPASEKEPEGWSAADKFTVVLETAGLNDTELGAFCRERGLFPEQVARWRQAAQEILLDAKGLKRQPLRRIPVPNGQEPSRLLQPAICQQ